MHAVVAGSMLRLVLVLALCALAVRQATASDAPAPDAEPASVLVLPPVYTSYDRDLEVSAQKKFADAARDALQADPRFLVVDEPELNELELATLREHYRLFLLVSISIEEAKVAGRAWVDTTRAADYRIGDGLEFLAERTGARYALMIVSLGGLGGSNTTSTIRLALADKGISFALVDLSSGRIVWHTSSARFGKGLSYRMPPDAVQNLVDRVLSTYPESPDISFADRSVPESRP